LSDVLALKYRPKRFDDLIGQDSISNTLSLALDKNRLSNAYLFSGLRGSGKTSTARIFSKALICDQGPTSKPCETCQNCTMANSNSHIDIIEMDAASHRGIDDIKDIIEHTKYKPNQARFKVFIIDEVHMLTIQAFNALLKTLEEPPEFVKFILATTDPLKLPATILSRTQHFRFKSIAKDNIIQHLKYILNKENIEYENQSLDIIARSGHGSLRDTLTILDQSIIYSKGNITTNSITDMLGILEPSFIENILNNIFNKDEKNIKLICKELESFSAETVLDEIIIYLKDKLLEKELSYSIIIVDRFFRILNDGKYLLNINSDSTFVLLITFLKMIEAIKIKDIDDLIKDYEQPILENKEDKNHIKDVEPKQDTLPKEKTSKDKFDIVTKSIYDRNRQIGDCFSNSISFISYENHLLKLELKANENDKATLRTNYKTIQQIIQEVFGENTKIEFEIKELEETQTKDDNSETKEIIQEEKKEQTSEQIKEHKEETIQEKLAKDLSEETFIKQSSQLLQANKISLVKK
jgi:DNA polymerase-3 subunit gamma/tau